MKSIPVLKSQLVKEVVDGQNSGKLWRRQNIQNYCEIMLVPDFLYKCNSLVVMKRRRHTVEEKWNRSHTRANLPREVGYVNQLRLQINQSGSKLIFMETNTSKGFWGRLFFL